jgi:hypothetical protein
VGGSHRRVDRACSTNLQGRLVVAPTIYAGQVFYARSLTGGDQGTAGSIRRYHIGSGRRTEVFSLKGRVVQWTATDSGQTFYVLSSGYLPGCAADPATGATCAINAFVP